MRERQRLPSAASLRARILADVRLWSTILNNCSDSIIYLKGNGYIGDKKKQIIRWFEDHQVSGDRVKIESASPRAELLLCYNQIDVALDPFPYPGGTTTCEALWMGVPTVTKNGDSFLSNVGKTIAINSGHECLCAANDEEYVNIAISLARDIQILNEKRIQRREKIMSSPLFDQKLFARDFGTLMKKTFAQFYNLKI